MEIKFYLKKLQDKIEKQKKVKNRIKKMHQEIALELCKEFNVDKKQYGMVFGFIKRLIEKGMWWKIKQVREQMAERGIYNIRYFMSCFNSKKNGHNSKKENN